VLTDLKAQLSEAKTAEEKGVLNRRIANLCGKICTITVGGTTPMEQKERKDRVDDAVLATKAAIEEGILPGGGIALLNAKVKIENSDRDSVLAGDILSAALKVPFQQILMNAGKSPSEIEAQIGDEEGKGYNVKTEEFGDMYEMGVIDPAKVTKTALSQAVSVASTILMSDTVITNIRA
jgi:chaperonin GroEL